MLQVFKYKKWYRGSSKARSIEQGLQRAAVIVQDMWRNELKVPRNSVPQKGGIVFAVQERCRVQLCDATEV